MIKFKGTALLFFKIYQEAFVCDSFIYNINPRCAALIEESMLEEMKRYKVRHDGRLSWPFRSSQTCSY